MSINFRRLRYDDNKNKNEILLQEFGYADTFDISLNFMGQALS